MSPGIWADSIFNGPGRRARPRDELYSSITIMMPAAATHWREMDEVEMPGKMEVANIYRGVHEFQD